MGNYSSCFYIPSKTAKLIDSQGNLRQVKAPAKAAELMLEEPGHVVSPVQELRRTRRLIALRAEDELLAGKFYLLVHLSKLNRKISESELGIIESAAAASKKKKSSKGRRGAKVLPAVANEAESEVKEELDMGFACCRLEKCRQWTPALEAITEEL
ncbi:hypothetical protein JCGZ_14015 [Jatropha curcas]|uniref:Uncharacterized protein n=1 Tax=Jatropha curcas TaxID=180498 RepID=A0A067K8Y0_JATCU|nr:hypothetical protein JCGZ_14015 [Jatropha curcas]